MLRPPLLGAILPLGGGPTEGRKVLSQMCRSPACLDAPWAPANSYLLVAAALPEGAAEGYSAHGCFAFAWVFVRGLEESVATVWLFAFLLEPPGRNCLRVKAKWNLNRVQPEAQEWLVPVGEEYPC